MNRRDIRQEAELTQQEIAQLGEEIEPSTQAVQDETVYVVRGDRFPNFGSRRIFDVPIPKPTPAPTPAPTPIVPPPLDAVLANWALQGVLTRRAVIQDKNTGEQPFIMELNGEARMVTSGGFAFMVQLVEINKKEYSVKLQSDQHPEPYTLRMFPPNPEATPQMP